jgi:hypothetical protein
MLPQRGLYQQCADRLPAGAILIVLPATQTPQRHALETIALQLKAAGHAVSTLVDAGDRAEGIQPPLLVEWA